MVRKISNRKGILCECLAELRGAKATTKAIADRLPKGASIKHFLLHAPGATNVCIVDQMARHVTVKEECRKLGKQEPKGDEVLLFDEVANLCGTPAAINFWDWQ